MVAVEGRSGPASLCWRRTARSAPAFACSPSSRSTSRWRLPRRPPTTQHAASRRRQETRGRPLVVARLVCLLVFHTRFRRCCCRRRRRRPLRRRRPAGLLCRPRPLIGSLRRRPQSPSSCRASLASSAVAVVRSRRRPLSPSSAVAVVRSRRRPARLLWRRPLSPSSAVAVVRCVCRRQSALFGGYGPAAAAATPTMTSFGGTL